MITGKLDNGFEFEIPEEARDDWEIVEAIEDYENGNPERIVTVARRLLGHESYLKLKEACRVNGRISFADMSDKIFEILNVCGETKN